MYKLGKQFFIYHTYTIYVYVKIVTLPYVTLPYS